MTTTADPFHEELENLRRRYRMYRARYRMPAIPEVENLETNIRRRRVQVAHLLEEAARLERHAAILEAEIIGYRKGLVALLTDFVDQAAATHAEHWSPMAVGGFRLWWLRDGRLRGAWSDWESPHREATCRYELDDDPPHLHGPCRSTGYGCGIYAAKSARRLLDTHVEDPAEEFVAGLVAMSGKVVEHHLGYRSFRAEVVAVVASLDGRRFRSAEPGAIAELFADPRAVDFSDGRWQPLDGPLTDTAAWLEEQKEGLDRWT